jgi:proline iminopeptidase
VVELYPPIEPYADGRLDVGDGNFVYWETSGNPDGKPAVLLHGGPGQGTVPGMRRGFDPERYRIVLFDQRGCGRSTPSASDPATDMSVNTTAHLIADIERLREHLGIGRWLVTGGSWGSALAIAYAEAHPDRVTEIVLSAITTARRSENDWLYAGASMFFPGEWQQFRDAAQLEPGQDARSAAVLGAAYARLMADRDPAVRAQAALAWGAWEDTVLSLEPGATAGVFSGPPDDDLMAIVRICAHYAAHGAWLEEGALIRGAGRLAGIPGVLVHGLLDLSCPTETAWELARAWPGCELVTDPGSGHRGSQLKRAATLKAMDAFALTGV